MGTPENHGAKNLVENPYAQFGDALREILGNERAFRYYVKVFAYFKRIMPSFRSSYSKDKENNLQKLGFSFEHYQPWRRILFEVDKDGFSITEGRERKIKAQGRMCSLPMGILPCFNRGIVVPFASEGGDLIFLGVRCARTNSGEGRNEIYVREVRPNAKVLPTSPASAAEASAGAASAGKA